jgi:hypothetical protein
MTSLPLCHQAPKIGWGGLLEGLTHHLLLPPLLHFLHLHHLADLLEEGNQMEGVRGGCTGCATKDKSEAAKACIPIPLLHWSLFIKMSYSFIKSFNVQVSSPSETMGKRGGYRFK